MLAALYGEKTTFKRFKQYVQLSETENNSCGQQMRDRSTYGENPAITSTPLVRRTDFQLNSYSNTVQQPNFDCTSIVQSGSVQTYSDRINTHPSYTPVMQRPELQSVSNGVNAQQSVFGFTPVVPRAMPQNLNNGITVHQPIIAYSSTSPSTVSQVNMTRNENRIIGNAVNAAQPIFLSGEEMYQGQLMFTANEEMISHEPLLYTGPGTDVHFLNDCSMLPQFINGSEVPHQQEFMNNTV